jgi:hypothetical protein
LYKGDGGILMEQILDCIKKIQKLEGLFIENKFYKYRGRMRSYLLIGTQTYSIVINDEADRKTESLVMRNIYKSKRMYISIDVNFERNFKNLIKQLKLELMYLPKRESWLSQFEEELLDFKLKFNRLKLVRELDNLLNTRTVQEREIRLFNILLGNSYHSIFLTEESVKILENDIVIGTLDINKIV